MNYTVAAIDYGIKHNILRLLEKHSCDVTVFPAETTAKEIIDFNPDGVFLSNGPGDPSAVTYGVSMVKNLLGKTAHITFRLVTEKSFRKKTNIWYLFRSSDFGSCFRSQDIQIKIWT